MPGDAIYWDDRYRTIGHANVSWFQHRPLLSLRFIESIDPPKEARIVDVGGGASALVDCLLDDAFMNLTVVDLSQAALDEASARISGNAVEWIQADIRTWRPAQDFDIWHDRAAYHFLTDPGDQQRYWRMVRDHLVPGGHIVIATFAEDGPLQCSGLDVARYSPEQLIAAMGEGFTPITTEREIHHTPSGGEQPFTWVLARRS